MAQHPYAAYEAHKTETAAYRGLYMVYARLYMEHRIGDFIKGMSLQDFMELTRDEADVILDLCLARIDDELAQQAQVTAEIDGKVQIEQQQREQMARAHQMQNQK